MKKWLFSLLTIASLGTAQAQFFGGYADGVTNMPTGNNSPIGPPLRMVYDDFTFDIAGDIISFEMIGLNNTGSPVAMYYEIRSGVSAGNGGTLLFSGNTQGATQGALPLDGSLGTPPPGPGQYGWYDGGLPVGSPIHLDPGTYWVGLAPLEQFGSFDVTSTQGLGSIGHPIDNGNAFYYDSSNPSADFISMGTNDFGLRVLTAASTVPEPGTLSLLGAAALGFLCWRRR